MIPTLISKPSWPLISEHETPPFTQAYLYYCIIMADKHGGLKSYPSKRMCTSVQLKQQIKKLGTKPFSIKYRLQYRFFPCIAHTEKLKFGISHY